MLKRKQRSIQEGVESTTIRGRDDKQPVLKVEITDFVTGITRTMYTQEEIVVAAAESNIRCQSQTVGTAFRQPALFDAFGSCTDNKVNYWVSSTVPLFLTKMRILLQSHYWRQWCSHSHSGTGVLSTASQLLLTTLKPGGRKTTT